jgi:hypothetical protein
MPFAMPTAFATHSSYPRPQRGRPNAVVDRFPTAPGMPAPRQLRMNFLSECAFNINQTHHKVKSIHQQPRPRLPACLVQRTNRVIGCLALDRFGSVEARASLVRIGRGLIHHTCH